jgi:hypothetical protein
MPGFTPIWLPRCIVSLTTIQLSLASIEIWFTAGSFALASFVGEGATDVVRYRKIETRIWNDRKFRSLSDDGKLVFLFTLTHPGLTSLGAMRATEVGLAAELGWPQERFAKGFRECSDNGLLEADFEACFLAAPNFLRYNVLENTNVVKSLGTVLELIPECTAKVNLLKRVAAHCEDRGQQFLTVWQTVSKPFAIPIGNGMPNQEPELEPELEPEEETAPANAGRPIQRELLGGESPKLTFENLVERWNLIDGVCHVRSVSADRRTAFKTRAKTPGWLADADRALDRIGQLPFCVGTNDRQWRANLDWFLRSGTVNGILEGKYDGRNGSATTSPRGQSGGCANPARVHDESRDWKNQTAGETGGSS